MNKQYFVTVHATISKVIEVAATNSGSAIHKATAPDLLDVGDWEIQAVEVIDIESGEIDA